MSLRFKKTFNRSISFVMASSLMLSIAPVSTWSPVNIVEVSAATMDEEVLCDNSLSLLTLDSLSVLLNETSTGSNPTDESKNPGESVSGGTEEHDDIEVPEGFLLSQTKDSYRFTMNEDSSLYDPNATIEFKDGEGNIKEFTGVYRSDVKDVKDNTSLRLGDVGTYKNPYVVLEIVPNASISEIRPQIADAGFFDLSYVDVYGGVDINGVTQQGITLTKSNTDTDSSLSEETRVRMNLIERIITEYNSAHDKEFAEEQARLQMVVFREQSFSRFSDVTNLLSSKVNPDDRKIAFENQVFNIILSEFASQKREYILIDIKKAYERIKKNNKDPYASDTSFWVSAYQELGYNYYYWSSYSTTSEKTGDGIQTYTYYELTEKDRSEVLVETNRLVTLLSEKFVQDDYQMSETTFKDFLSENAEIPLPEYENFKKMCVPMNELNNRGSKSVSQVLKELEDYIFQQGIMSEREYTDLLEQKYADALEYKRNNEKMISYAPMVASNQYKYNYDYLRQYEVDTDGKFMIYQTNEETKTVVTPAETYNRQASKGEYAMSTKVYNPLATSAASMYSCNNQSGFLVPDYTFRKACMNLAYKKVQEGSDEIVPCVDEYIFAGWLVDTGGETLVELTSITDEELKDINDLYTKWIVRDYGTTTYKQLVLGKKDYVKCDMDGGYTVYLPNTIACQHTKNARFHNIHNQLKMCVPVSTNVLFLNNSNQFEESRANYTEEISSWVFNFDKSVYNTVAKIQQVAPLLMADTDYYVRTYNPVPRSDGAGGFYVEYQPYNIQVITASPQELNKLVYYEYSQNTTDSNYYDGDKLKYNDTKAAADFLNNVDFVYFSNGGTSRYFETDGSMATYGTSGGGRKPTISRMPELCKISDGKLSFDKTKVKTTSSFFGDGATTDALDLEWQIAFKIYSRSADRSQARRIAVIFNEAFSDKISGEIGTPLPVKDKDGKYNSAGTFNNFAKLDLMYFAYVDPTMLYDMYVDPNYMVNNGAKIYTFDKMKGCVRDEKYKETWFTGDIYECQKWNQATFFPFEYFNPDEEKYPDFHKAIMSEMSPNYFSIYNPWNSGVTYPNNDGVSVPVLGPDLYDALGLMRNANCKNIANPYAYTFNGGNDLSSAFITKDRAEVRNILNSLEGSCVNKIPDGTYGNTFLAFEYFRKVRPSEISSDGKISTKSAIEFMVQNAQNGLVNYEDRLIRILNPDPMKNRYEYIKGQPIEVEKVTAQDLDVMDVYVDFDFSGSTSSGSVLKTEYYWTYQFKNIDNDNRWGDIWYKIYTAETANIKDRWFKMPDSSTLPNEQKKEYFKTFAEDQTTEVFGITKNPDHYYFNALIKPEITHPLFKTNGITSIKPNYIIVVKEYRNQADADNNKSPLSITTKNVTVSKLSLLFNLD